MTRGQCVAGSEGRRTSSRRRCTRRARRSRRRPPARSPPALARAWSNGQVSLGAGRTLYTRPHRPGRRRRRRWARTFQFGSHVLVRSSRSRLAAVRGTPAMQLVRSRAQPGSSCCATRQLARYQAACAEPRSPRATVDLLCNQAARAQRSSAPAFEEAGFGQLAEI
ncbi:hypothetical protein T492DRAFT_842567 [Pavlovales sp. CCMP2436]|nr:hypothetical protein T492DRAFT_842567 [Pavlovales sp. CCMP2436]